MQIHYCLLTLVYRPTRVYCKRSDLGCVMTWLPSLSIGSYLISYLICCSYLIQTHYWEEGVKAINFLKRAVRCQPARGTRGRLTGQSSQVQFLGESMMELTGAYNPYKTLQSNNAGLISTYTKKTLIGIIFRRIYDSRNCKTKLPLTIESNTYVSTD